ITKFINALSAASETGGPAASAHLLGQPDHYTDHFFKTFFWKSYVRRICDSTPAPLRPLADGDNVHAETVMLGSSAGRIVPMSKVDDYVYRPQSIATMSLYNFLRGSDVKLLPKNTVTDNSDVVADNGTSTLKSGGILRFDSNHPRFATHGIAKRALADWWTLNFAGGVLPRPDRGDREEYCQTMLTIFAPSGWRVASDLLLSAESWSAAFDSCEFDADALRMMANMNVLYECQDARDDFSA
ncbi:hypothetical protein BC628DRAFT_1278661, partial [Trametes gibbosa]